MKRLLIALLLLCFVASAETPTHLSDTWPGSPSGTLTVSWPSFTAADSTQVGGGSFNYAVNDGVVSLYLQPNAGATAVSPPVYTVSFYNPTTASYTYETWSVPVTSSPVTLAEVICTGSGCPSGSGASTSGTINSGTSGQFAYYAGAGTTLSGHTLALVDFAALFSGTGQASFAGAVGPFTSGDCAKWNSTGDVIDAGAPCGSGGGSSAWASLTPGTNTSGAFILGSGASLAATGSGTIAATSVPGTGVTGATVGYLYNNGSTSSWGNILTGASGALDCVTVPGVCDVVTALVPLKASANVFTGLMTWGTSAAATSGANQVGNMPFWESNYWNGSASVHDDWQWLPVIGTGANPTTTLTLAHSGSSGTAAVSIPFPVTVGSLPATDVTGLATSATVDATIASNITSGTLPAGRLPSTAVTKPELYNVDVVKDYNASGSSVTTTLSATASASATSITVTSASTFSAGQGMLIGVSGANASATTAVVAITSVVGSVINFTPALVSGSSYAIGANVQHDDSVAIQLAINALATSGGTARFPLGFYRANNCNASGNNNSVWTFPNTPLNSGFTSPITPIVFSSYLIGTFPIIAGEVPMIQTDCTSGSLLNSPASISGSGFLAFAFTVDKMAFRSYANPSVTMVDLSRLAQMGNFVGTIDTGQYPPVQPTSTNGVGLLTPAQGNWSVNTADYVLIMGYYTALVAGAHTNIKDGFLFWNYQAIAVKNWGDHSVHADFLDVERFHYLLVDIPHSPSSGWHNSIQINHLQLENDDDGQWTGGTIVSGTNQIDVSDSTNDLYCDIGYELTQSDPWVMNGGTNCYASNIGAKDALAQIKLYKGVQVNQLQLGAAGPVMTATTGNGTKMASVATTGAPGNCANWDASGNVADAGSACGSGGGSSAFASLTSGTNTTAAMLVGSGASLAATGSGTIVATSVPASGLPADYCQTATYSILASSLSGTATAPTAVTLVTLASTDVRICFLEIMPSTAFTVTGASAATVRLQSSAGTPVLYTPNQDVSTISANNFWSDAGSAADRASGGLSVNAQFAFPGASTLSGATGAVKFIIGTRTVATGY